MRKYPFPTQLLQFFFIHSQRFSLSSTSTQDFKLQLQFKRSATKSNPTVTMTKNRISRKKRRRFDPQSDEDEGKLARALRRSVKTIEHTPVHYLSGHNNMHATAILPVAASATPHLTPSRLTIQAGVTTKTTSFQPTQLPTLVNQRTDHTLTARLGDTGLTS